MQSKTFYFFDNLLVPLQFRPTKYENYTGIGGAFNSQPEVESAGGLSAFRNLGRPTKDGILGTASAPIHMLSAEGGHFKEQLWRTFRTLGMAFLLISGVGALIEDRGISKGNTIF